MFGNFAINIYVKEQLNNIKQSWVMQINKVKSVLFFIVLSKMFPDTFSIADKLYPGGNTNGRWERDTKRQWWTAGGDSVWQRLWPAWGNL